MSGTLSIKGLTKRFGGVCAVSDFSLELEKGAIHGLIGPNGAGKTTIFNLITGIYEPTEGDLSFQGAALKGLKPFEVARLGIGRTFQNIRLFSKLSVLDNVIMASNTDAEYAMVDAIFKTKRYRTHEEAIKKRSLELLELLGLQNMVAKKAGDLPYGSQRKLEIARALALRPKVVLLDEPAAGMNPEESMELVGFVRSIRERFDLTILLIEHHMDVIMNICDRITVLNFGKTLCSGTPKEIQGTQCVIEAYLGVAEGEERHAED